MTPSTDQLVYLIDADEVVRDSLKVLFESHGLDVQDFGTASDFLRWTRCGMTLA